MRQIALTLHSGDHFIRGKLWAFFLGRKSRYIFYTPFLSRFKVLANCYLPLILMVKKYFLVLCLRFFLIYEKIFSKFPANEIITKIYSEALILVVVLKFKNWNSVPNPFNQCNLISTHLIQLTSLLQYYNLMDLSWNMQTEAELPINL